MYGKIARRKPLLSKKNIAARLRFAKGQDVDEPEDYWKKVLWMDESKTDSLGLNEKRRLAKTKHCWFGAALLLREQGGLQSLTELWTLDCTSRFYRTMSGCLFVNWSSTKGGSCSKTMTLNTQVSLPKTVCLVLEWPSQSPDLDLIEMLWKDLKWAVHAMKPTNITELKQFCKEEWADVREWSTVTENIWLLMLLKGVTPTESKASHTFPTKDN